MEELLIRIRIGYGWNDNMPREKEGLGDLDYKILKKIKIQPMGTTEISLLLGYRYSSGCSRNLKKLKELGLIKIEKKKWRILERGLKSLKPFEESAKIMSDDKKGIKTYSLTDHERNDLEMAIDRFDNAVTEDARKTIVYQINQIITHLRAAHPSINWEKEKKFKKWIRKYLEDPDKYNIPNKGLQIKYGLFAILPSIYECNYFDVENFKQLIKYCKSKTMKEDDMSYVIFDCIAEMTISVMKNRPEDGSKEPYDLFILLIQKIRFCRHTRFLANKKNDIIQLSDEIKDRLKRDLYEILNEKIECPSDENDMIINELFNILHSNY